MMEKTLQQIQFKDRLCRTLLRVNWMILIVAMLPVFLQIFIGVTIIGIVFYFLLLISVTIISFGLFLLNESFRALYKINLDGLKEISDQIVKAYRTVLPVLAVACVIISAITFFIIIRNQDETHKTGKIVSLSFNFILFLIVSLIYYINLA